MRQRAGILLTIVAAAALPARAAETLETAGTVDAVTVYRGQALVTRIVEVPGPAGLREVIVKNLPDQVVPASIYAESADGVQVRSVRYRLRPVATDVRDEVRQYDEQIQDVQDKIEANTRHAQWLGEHKAYLAKLEQFVAPTANVELTQGVLNADTLKSLTEFLFEQRQKLSGEDLELHRDNRALQEQLSLLQRKRELVAGSSTRTLREAVVFVNLEQPDGRLRVRYLVGGASWSPSYNVRTDAERKNVIVEYQASVQQRSGEAWDDVSMTLSTATPSLAAKAPNLEPLALSLSSGFPGQGQGQGQSQAAGPLAPLYFGGARYEKGKEALLEQQRDAERKRALAAQQQQAADVPAGGAPAADERQLDRELNEVAKSLQLLDLMAQGRLKRPEEPAPAAPAEGLAVTYRLADRTSLPSRADQQLIQIASIPLAGSFYKLATPVLTGYVYEQARVTNESELVLLAGPAANYVDGQFVGHTQMPTVAVGESFTVGFGIDSSLRASRELVEKTETIQGGNRLVTVTYRLALENFGAQPADIRLLDRLPVAKESDVKITLVSPGEELSDDADYLQKQRKDGILRWELQVPSQAIGTKALALEYQFQLEYDKQMSVTGLPLAGR
jgi:hypothetical protein